MKGGLHILLKNIQVFLYINILNIFLFISNISYIIFRIFLREKFFNFLKNNLKENSNLIGDKYIFSGYKNQIEIQSQNLNLNQNQSKSQRININ
jgi:hypothetical protein